MLKRQDIENAVQIQKRSYMMLRWIAEAIDRGLITFSRSHGNALAADAAFDWILEHFQDFPESVRPQPDQLRPFSNYFSSYVTTSFDLFSDPRRRLDSSCGCYCHLCSHLVVCSHLQPKKLSKRDKDRALNECISRVGELAQEEGFQISAESAAALVKSHRRAAAYSTYGFALLERISGSEGGIHILALWRMIAWKPEGSPIKDFTLEADDILNAERELIEAIRR